MSATATNSSDNGRALWPALAAAAAVTLAAWIWFVGRAPDVPGTPPVTPAPSSTGAAPAPLSASQVQRGITRAQADVKKDPQDAAAWAMLAHSSAMAGRFDEAAAAYRELLKLRPQDAQVHADFADALGVAHQGSLQGEPARLLVRALELEPGNTKALVLAGKEAFERRRFAEAVAFWQRAREATQDPRLRGPIETSIAEAQALQAPGRVAESSQPFVAGRVTVAAALKDRIGPDDTVFVFARPADGSRMPVALLRRKGRELPLDFALDDSLAMTREARLSQNERVMLGVRVSKRGDAIPASGDLEGELGPVKLGSAGLVLELSRVRP